MPETPRESQPPSAEDQAMGENQDEETVADMRVPERVREGDGDGDGMEEEAPYSPDSPAPMPSPEKMQVTEEMAD